jgi:hypothetical protein
MKLKIALAAASIAASAMFVTAAQANPVYIGYQIGSGPINVLSTNDGSTVYFNNNLAGDWNVLLTAQGTSTPSTPLDLPEPNFTSTNATVGSAGSGQISIYMSQTGLSNQAISGLISGFTSNQSSTLTVSEASYLQACTGAGNTCDAADIFATTNLMASDATLAPNTAVSDVTLFPASFYTDPTALYDETVEYTFTFGPTGGTANATIGLTAIPEPLTLSLFGAGLLGAGALRRRKKAA